MPAESVRESTMPGDSIQGAFWLSAAIHVIILLLMMFLGHNYQQKPMLQLTEIDVVEPVEVPEFKEVVVEKKKKKKPLDFIKKAIPKKPQIRQPKRSKPQPVAEPQPAKRVIKPGGPLISKQSVRRPLTGGGIISKKSISRQPGINSPQWESGPGRQQGVSGRQLNLKTSTRIAQQRAGVVDQEIASSLKGQGRNIAINRSSDIRGVVAGVQRSKRSVVGRGSGTANLKGFRDAFAVFGQISNRKILRMKMPKYPAWAEEQGIEASVTVALSVYADGLVKESSVYVEATSGYKELDRLAMAAAKNFIFAALPQSKGHKLESGSIRFVFKLKR